MLAYFKTSKILVMVEPAAAVMNSFISTWWKMNTANTSFRDGSLFTGKVLEESTLKGKSFDRRTRDIEFQLSEEEKTQHHYLK